METPHDKHMSRALKLAAKGRGRVSPNPMVGAVIVKDNRVIGEGYHEKFGSAHAEINAIENAQKDCKDTTLYLNLEPCCHQGKTPPCVDAIIKEKFARVVIALQDPNPKTNGKSIEKLRAADIEVIDNIMTQEAADLNRPFLKLMRTGKPFVTAKWAMTLDGKIATRTGDSKWISSSEALDYGHQLRNQTDAIMVGMGTVLKDDPLLTCRRVPEGRNPLRIILDSSGKLRKDYKVIKTAREIPTLIVLTDEASDDSVQRLQDNGCEILQVPSFFGMVDISQLLLQLAERNIGQLLIEGGSQVLGSAFDSKEVDEAVILIAPKIIGGARSITPIGGLGKQAIHEATCISQISAESIGPDLVVRGRVVYK